MEVEPNEVDAWVDDAVLGYLTPGKYKSFFLFAGAGSGKTKTLVEVLKKFKKLYKEQFRLGRKKIAIITYTNAAADEITRRLEFDTIFQVSTIHSFSWELIKPFTDDIRNWLKVNLKEEINELEVEQRGSRNPQNKTSIDRAKRIESKAKRLQLLDSIISFVYNPNGDNDTKNSLIHSEVISIAAEFILNKPLMQRLLAAQFPILLIDESQDTKKELIDSIFTLQQAMPESICVGLFGDTMQRIYSDGKENLQKAFPKNWETPRKQLNHRSNKRIIRLINSIREDVDNEKQNPRIEKEEGTVRLFICNRAVEKSVIEGRVIEEMANITQDSFWNQELGDDGKPNVKMLILEHHMAAQRMGFFEFFAPLYAVDKFSTGIRDGSLPGIALLTKTILPLLQAHKSNDKYELARIIKGKSPLFHSARLKQSKDQLESLKACREAADELLKLWDEGNDPSLLEVVICVFRNGLFTIPEGIYPIVARSGVEINRPLEQDEIIDEGLVAWEKALTQPFSQIEKYNDYISDNSKFGTQQGVKGLEYKRVMVIIDDEEAKGFLFSYDKLFGAKELTATDQKNIREGKETGIDRTKRLFYVACSRARESLAIICYTTQPEAMKNSAVAFNWFTEHEIEMI
ncbi:UvrD-helicase domain-containing protein [Chitinophaga sp. LS1]|uniref:UvrD-helicase domain-containing protein n=1 Tax=Chitinophaga sp. LS1 TaxID=3051176 RepID=UPI002AABD648|nr:UvrD-helicase domain-containing protein [Chitinophaga sp. LS1]WPV67114.1 UvrD-helicase domain-containing protein [Chitinophaga sp. LS1]